MILWSILPQPNPFLTVLVDPNGPTRGGWCEGDALPWHRYRLHRQTLAREPGLLLLGAFRETLHSSEGKPIKRQQSMWLTLLNEQAHDISLSTHTFICTWICMQGHECTDIFSFFLFNRQLTQQYIQSLLEYISNIFHCATKAVRCFHISVFLKILGNGWSPIWQCEGNTHDWNKALLTNWLLLRHAPTIHPGPLTF